MQWDEMDAEQRNNLVGKLIDAKPLSQLWIGWSGIKKLQLPATNNEIQKYREALKEIQKIDIKWNPFIAKHHPTIMHFMRGQLEIIDDQWYMRYSDTPGGGWEVIEALRAKGARIVIESELNGWSMRTDLNGRSYVWCGEPSIAEAACRSAVALLSLKPS